MVQPGVTAPIASATNDKHLTDLIEATRLKLDHASIEKLTTVSAPSIAVKA
jgi:aryl-alcohol dehydrogenase-like predicted oxidoreductase